MQKKHPAFTIAPQCPKEKRWVKQKRGIEQIALSGE
jgi:hypothetical protein